MKKSIKIIGIIATMGIMLVCAYLLGTAQAKTVTEVQTVTKTREVVSNEYIQPDKANDSFVDMRTVIDFTATEYGLQLYFEDGTGYWYKR